MQTKWIGISPLRNEMPRYATGSCRTKMHKWGFEEVYFAVSQASWSLFLRQILLSSFSFRLTICGFQVRVVSKVLGTARPGELCPKQSKIIPSGKFSMAPRKVHCHRLISIDFHIPLREPCFQSGNVLMQCFYCFARFFMAGHDTSVVCINGCHNCVMSFVYKL